MRRLRFALPALAGAAALLLAPAAACASPAPPAPRCRGAFVTPTAATAGLVRHATLCLLNRERTARHLPPLRLQPSLQRAAGSYARLMVLGSFFAHVTPAGTTMRHRILRTAYLRGARAWRIGENIAWASGAAATPARIVASWMRSAPHRANILDRGFREIGIGIAPGSPRRAGPPSAADTYTTEFGARRTWPA